MKQGSGIRSDRQDRPVASRSGTGRLVRTVIAWSVLTAANVAMASGAAVFASPEKAAGALFDAARSGNPARTQRVLGPESARLGTGDPAFARREREAFITAYAEKHEIRRDGERRATLVFGNDDWSFPIPLVKSGQGWRFDTAAGREEIINRRIGRNELNTIEVLLAIADAQADYAAADRNGDGMREYAQRFASTPGKRDGLYWPSAAGRDESPLGPLVAQATREGYVFDKRGPTPYWGYYYRILTGQGPAAPGGSYDYLAADRMIGGFAVVAWPAEYGQSGVKTFMISHQGTVFEKDLGPATAESARAFTRFDPGEGWIPVRNAGTLSATGR